MGSILHRLLKNAHLRRSPHPSLLQRTFKYASLLRISGALHLGIFDQPEKSEFFNKLFIADNPYKNMLNPFVRRVWSCFTGQED